MAVWNIRRETLGMSERETGFEPEVIRFARSYLVLSGLFSMQLGLVITGLSRRASFLAPARAVPGALGKLEEIKQLKAAAVGRAETPGVPLKVATPCSPI
jgi:hypothetical protein